MSNVNHKYRITHLSSSTPKQLIPLYCQVINATVDAIYWSIQKALFSYILFVICLQLVCLVKKFSAEANLEESHITLFKY
jgi:hypothetical protein